VPLLVAKAESIKSHTVNFRRICFSPSVRLWNYNTNFKITIYDILVNLFVTKINKKTKDVTCTLIYPNVVV